MNREEFKKYIKSIGFENLTILEDIYDIPGISRIYIDCKFYDLIYSDNNQNDVNHLRIPFDNFDILNKYFKKKIRSIKLKKILNINGI